MFGTKKKAAAAEAPRAAVAEKPANFGAALDAACDAWLAADLDANCSTYGTLSDLAGALNEDGTIQPDAELPALEAVDKALAELADLKLPARTRHALAQLRETIAVAKERAETLAARIGAEVVTRREFEAFKTAVAIALTQIEFELRHPGLASANANGRLRVAACGHYGLSGPEQAALEDLLERISRAGKLDDAHERRQAVRYPGQRWSTS